MVGSVAMNEQPPSQNVSDPLAQQWEKSYSVGMHLTTLAMTFFVPVVPALIMWLIKKDESPFVNDHGREVVNFQLSLVIYGIAAAILTMIVVGIVVWIAVFVLALVGLIMGAVAAGNGRYFRYPACIRFIK